MLFRLVMHLFVINKNQIDTHFAVELFDNRSYSLQQPVRTLNIHDTGGNFKSIQGIPSWRGLYKKFTLPK